MKRTCPVTGESISGHIDETRMPRKFNIQTESFCSVKTEGVFHYIVQLLETIPHYITIYVGANNFIDYIASEIIKKTLQTIEFV